jgi:hypothetical protein
MPYFCYRLVSTPKITLDDKITVEISVGSSFSSGTPPFEWSSNQDILYMHMIPEERDNNLLPLDGKYVLKCANAKSKNVIEWQRKRLPLTYDGGRMHSDWLTGELKYQNFTVETSTHSMLQLHPCYSVKRSQDGTEVWFRKKLLHHHKGKHISVQGCPSPSKQHFAFFVRSNDNTDIPAVHALTKDMNQPVKVAHVPFYTTLVSWIENTDTLRKKHLNNKTKSHE